MVDQITADGVGDNPFGMAKAAKPRKRSGGIGHNSGVTTEVLQENVSLETISERLAIAQVKVVEYDAAWRSSTAEVEKKATETISAIYLVSHEIQVAGAYDQFMAKYGLSVHGNVRSRSRPIVNFCFLQMDRSYAKSTISLEAIAQTESDSSNSLGSTGGEFLQAPAQPVEKFACRRGNLLNKVSGVVRTP